jgi:hypothetical protein
MNSYHVLHKSLCEKLPLYARWHKHPRHTLHHFIVFLAVSFGTTALLLSSIYTVDLSGGMLNFIPTRIIYAEETMTTNELTDQLVKNLDGYSRGGGTERTARLKGLQRTASFRRNSLEAQIRTSPEDALLNVLPEAVLNALPPDIKSTQEKYVSLEGTVAELHVDNLDGTSLEQFKLIQKNNTQVDMFLAHEHKNFLTNRKIRFKGVQVGLSLIHI